MAVLGGVGLLLLAFAYPCLSLTDDQKSFTRKVSTPSVNPGCNLPKCTSAAMGNASNIVYVKAEGPGDALHYLFSTMGPPTLVISRTPVGAALFINWTQTFVPGLVPVPTIQYLLDGKPIRPDRSFGIIFTRLYEFNDTQDQADITQIPADRSNWVVRKLSDFNWSFANVSADDEVLLTSNLTENGTFTFKIRTYGADGRSDYSPHLEYTANSTEISVELMNITNSTASSRFALEMAIYDTGDSNTWQDATSLTTQQSLDDEYSPGVFQLLSWQTNQTQDPLPGGGYAQWKPVCYVKPTMTRGDLTRATVSPLLTANSNSTWWNVVADIGLVDYIFGTYGAASLSINATNITLGYSGDGFYSSTNYTIWTVSVGMGAAPSDEVSLLVIIVIAIGLGIPVVLIAFGGVLLCVRKRRERQQSVYTPINED